MPDDEGTQIEGTLLQWDSRPQVWARFASAALHTLDAAIAARVADEMLAEYEQRFPNADDPVEAPVPGADGGA